jgi:hypothetical protein
MVDGTGTIRAVALKSDGVSGPKFTGPEAIATKKLTLDPWVKRKPLIWKLSPALIVLGIELINGPLGVGVSVGVRLGVGVRVGV